MNGNLIYYQMASGLCAGMLAASTLERVLPVTLAAIIGVAVAFGWVGYWMDRHKPPWHDPVTAALDDLGVDWKLTGLHVCVGAFAVAIIGTWLVSAAMAVLFGFAGSLAALLSGFKR